MNVTFFEPVELKESLPGYRDNGRQPKIAKIVVLGANLAMSIVCRCRNRMPPARCGRQFRISHWNFELTVSDTSISGSGGYIVISGCRL